MSGFNVSPITVWFETETRHWCYEFSISHAGTEIILSKGYHRPTENEAIRSALIQARELLHDLMLDAAREVIRLENDVFKPVDVIRK